MAKALKNASTSSSAKLDMLLRHMLALGCRCPFEPTLKLVTSLWLCLSESPQSILAMSAAMKHAFLRGVKASFDKLRRLAPTPPAHVVKLPRQPAEFLRGFPSMWAVAFGIETPVTLDGPCRSARFPKCAGATDFRGARLDALLTNEAGRQGVVLGGPFARCRGGS